MNRHPAVEREPLQRCSVVLESSCRQLGCVTAQPHPRSSLQHTTAAHNCRRLQSAKDCARFTLCWLWLRAGQVACILSSSQQHCLQLLLLLWRSRLQDRTGPGSSSHGWEERRFSLLNKQVCGKLYCERGEYHDRTRPPSRYRSVCVSVPTPPSQETCWQCRTRHNQAAAAAARLWRVFQIILLIIIHRRKCDDNNIPEGYFQFKMLNSCKMIWSSKNSRLLFQMQSRQFGALL